MSRREVKKVWDVREKLRNIQYYVDLSLNRTLRMFKYKNLPDTLPEEELERILQLHGYGIITKEGDDLIALWGGYAPPLNTYYRHTKMIVANPWANINKTYTFNEDCILIRNDPLSKGLLPIFKRYGTLLTEADITMYLAMINLRTIYSIVTGSDAEAESARIFLQQVEEGKQGVLLEDMFSEGIRPTPMGGQSGYITQVIELEQYIKGSFFNDVGLNANFNMKRERLTSSETELNEDGLRPLIDTMLEERKKAIEKVNAMYGTNIEVEFDSAWSQYNPQEQMVVDGEVVNEETHEEVVEENGEEIITTNENSSNLDEVPQDDVEVPQEEKEENGQENITININIENAGEVSVEAAPDDIEKSSSEEETPQEDNEEASSDDDSNSKDKDEDEDDEDNK